MRPNAHNNSKIYDYFVFIKLIFNILPKNVNNNHFFLMSVVGINTIYEFYANELNEIRVYKDIFLHIVILTYVLRNLFYTTILHIIYGIGKVFQ